MHCPKCNKRMKKQLWGFCYYYVCEYCGYIVITDEVENDKTRNIGKNYCKGTSL